MIVKTSQGHKVVSKKGKSLSEPNLTKEQAETRLSQIEWLKKKNDEPINIEEIEQQLKELKEGQTHQSKDGKVRFVREKGNVVMRDSEGNHIMAQPSPKPTKITTKNFQKIHDEWEANGKKGKEPKLGETHKTKRVAPEGVVYKDPKTIARYEQESLDAGLEEGSPTGENDFSKIAETSENPSEIKAAWKEEKSRLEERKS